MLETSMGMEQHVQQSSQKTYVPAIVLPRATLKNSLQRLPVTVKGARDHVCGAAQRVGYTGHSDDDLAIYRLKVKFGKNFSTITLPGFFVIEDGIFQSYEQWCSNRKTEK